MSTLAIVSLVGQGEPVSKEQELIDVGLFVTQLADLLSLYICVFTWYLYFFQLDFILVEFTALLLMFVSIYIIKLNFRKA